MLFNFINKIIMARWQQCQKYLYHKEKLQQLQLIFVFTVCLGVFRNLS